MSVRFCRGISTCFTIYIVLNHCCAVRYTMHIPHVLFMAVDWTRENKMPANQKNNNKTNIDLHKNQVRGHVVVQLFECSFCLHSTHVNTIIDDNLIFCHISDETQVETGKPVGERLKLNSTCVGVLIVSYACAFIGSAASLTSIHQTTHTHFSFQYNVNHVNADTTTREMWRMAQEAIESGRSICLIEFHLHKNSHTHLNFIIEYFDRN